MPVQKHYSRSNTTFLRLSVLLLVPLLGVGCQSVTSVVSNPFSQLPKLPEERPVAEMICIWEEAEGIGLDNKPTRGFAGQVMFFAANHSEPVPVNGDVEIYLFDDQGHVDEQTKPLHVFRFEKEAFHGFVTETNLGIAYQMFLPYVRKTNYKANCMLRVKITPESGRPIYSKMAAVNLGGPESPAAIARRKAEEAKVVQVEHTPQAEAPSPEEAAAYFGKATLPKQKNDTRVVKQRLKSALHEIVQQEQARPNQLPAEAVSNSTPVPAQSQETHPLLLD